MKRAVLYARVSRADQSIALQLDEGKAIIARRGWELVETFIDEGVSGAKASRPGLDAMLEAARRHRFDVLVVWRSDRLFRSLSNMVQTIEELSARRIDFVSVMEPFDTSTPSGRLLFQIVSAMAEFERALIVERSMAGVAAARRRGKHPGRPRVAVDLERARKELARRGASMRSVAKKLGVTRSTLQRALAGGVAQIGPYKVRACCGAQLGAPHFKGCRGAGEQIAAATPPIGRLGVFAAPAKNGRWHAMQHFDISSKTGRAACDHRLELDNSAALNSFNVAEQLRCARSTCAGIFADEDARHDEATRKNRRRAS